MAGYSQDVLEDLRQGNDIIDVISQYVQLKQTGANHMGLCPFHNEKSPSFSVSAQKQLFHCFGCGESGNVFSFVMKIENLGFLDAVKFLADRISYSLPAFGGADSASITEKNQMFDIYKLAARYYYDALQGPRGKQAAAYLDSRRITPAARRRFGLGVSAQGGLGDMLAQKGYDTEFLIRAGLVIRDNRDESRHYDRFRNRLIFPIFDVSGKVISFGGRILGEGQPKYMNSPETPIFDKSRTLYGLNYARQAKADTMILVEGYMDVIALHQAGFTNTAAALGTAFTANAARILSRYCKQAIVLFDGDTAGIKATLRATRYLYLAGIAARVAVLPGAKDPDEYIINFGPKALGSCLDRAIDFVEFEIETARKKYNLDITAQKVGFLKEAARILKGLNTAIERDSYIRDISAKYAIDQAAMREHIGSDEGEVISLPAAGRRNRPVGQTKAFADAASHILYSMAQEASLCGKITARLDAHEMVSPLYIKLYNAIAAARLRGGEIALADVITAMEDAQEQKAAAAVFAEIVEYESAEAQHTALADQIKLIKMDYLEKLIDEMDKDKEFERFAGASQELNRLKRQKISL
jgi:DNA primase